MYLENVLQNADKEVLFYLKLILSNESANWPIHSSFSGKSEVTHHYLQ
jgi:hypothetical protein